MVVGELTTPGLKHQQQPTRGKLERLKIGLGNIPGISHAYLACIFQVYRIHTWHVHTVPIIHVLFV